MESLIKIASKALAEWGSRCVDLLKNYHVKAGQKTTGKTLDSFRTEQEADGDVVSQMVYGAHYVGTLEYGRRPGKYPPVLVIQKWAEHKGVIDAGLTEAKKRSIAFAISKKMAEQGSFMHRSGGVSFAGFKSPVGQAIEDVDIDALKKAIGSGVLLQIKSDVLQKYKELDDKVN